MNGSIRALAITLLCLLAFTVAIDSHAEVSAKSDRRGNYIVTRVVPAGGEAEPEIWTPLRDHVQRSAALLNPDGDANGDLWPAIVENRSDNGHPWVAWSRFNGEDYDLAWSRWTSGGWTEIAWVERESSPGDDLDPAITFDFTGQAHMIWWRDLGGHGEVYLSSYVDGAWLEPFRVSDPALDSRYPLVRVDREGQLTIEYYADGDSKQEIWALHQDSTITDDINPQLRMRGRTSRSGPFVYIRVD
jgi:hypothetical protein